MLTRNIQSHRFKTSAEAYEKLVELRKFSSCTDHLISRLALAISLSDPEPVQVVERPRKGGKELRGETFFRMGSTDSDPTLLPYFAALVVEHLGMPLENDDTIIQLIEEHWERGIFKLCSLVEEHKTWASTLEALGRRIISPAAPDATKPSASMASLPGRIPALTVEVGQLPKASNRVSLTLNDARAWNNPHLVVTGMSGTGKTQMAKQIIASAIRCSKGRTRFIFLDYAKGDVAGDESFVRATGAKVYRLPGDILPISPFRLPKYTEDTCRLAAEDKRECYRNLIHGLGPKQEGRLAEAIFEAYDCREGDPHRVPDFNSVREVLLQRYAEEELPEDVLTEIFRRLTTYKLFWNRDSDIEAVPSLSEMSWIIDIHSLSGLQEIVAFTVIEQLYREMKQMPDASVDPNTGMRETRCILALDEAHHYLPKKNKFLQGLIREGRSKGLMVLLLSQSPDDFDQRDFDYTEQLEFVFLLGCKAKTKSIERILGCGRGMAKDIALLLGKLGPFEGIARRLTPGKGDPQRLTVLPFFQGEGRRAGT